MRRRKSVEPRFFVGIAAVAVLCILSAVYSGVTGNPSPVSRAAGAVIRPVQRLASGIGGFFGRGFGYFTEFDQLKAENEELKKQLRENEQLVRDAQLAIEENKKITLTEAQILAFLDYVCEMPADDVNKRRAIINIFVHSIYLYDDHFTLIINASKKPLSIDNIPLDDIESVFEGSGGASEGCSSLNTPAPPKRNDNFLSEDCRFFLFSSLFSLPSSLELPFPDKREK